MQSRWWGADWSSRRSYLPPDHRSYLHLRSLSRVSVSASLGPPRYTVAFPRRQLPFLGFWRPCRLLTEANFHLIYIMSESPKERIPEEDDTTEAPLSMAASVVLSSLPKDASKALETAGNLNVQKGTA